LGPITDSTTANSTNRSIGVIIRVDGMLPSDQSHRYGQWRRYLRRVFGRRGRKNSWPDPILLLNDFASDIVAVSSMKSVSFTGSAAVLGARWRSCSEFFVLCNGSAAPITMVAKKYFYDSCDIWLALLSAVGQGRVPSPNY
jgi:hypothetical protein